MPPTIKVTKHFSKELIPNSFGIICFFTLMMLIGLVLVPRVSLRLNPVHKSQQLKVFCHWENASPRMMDSEIGSILEAGINTLRGVKRMESIAEKGSVNLNITLDKYTEMAAFRFLLASKIRQLFPEFPIGVSFPEIIYEGGDATAEQSLIMQYALNGPHSPAQMLEYGDAYVRPLFFDVEGLAKLEFSGANPMEYLVKMKSNYSLGSAISKEEVLNGLSHYFDEEDIGYSNLKQPNGDWISSPLKLRNTSTNDFETEWPNIPIKRIGKQLIRLGQFAAISRQETPANSFYRVNGKQCVYLLFYASKGANQLDLAKKIKEKIKLVKQKMPTAYQLVKLQDESVYLSKEIQKIQKRSLLTILVLLIFVMISARNWRYLCLICFCLLVNLSLCFMIYYFLGIEMHLYSLAALTISLGLLIDNIIIMIDHIRHFHNRKAFLSILAATLTSLSSLAVITFLPDQIKMQLTDFALVMMINLSISLFTALFLIPALMQRFPLDREKRIYRPKELRRIARANLIYLQIIRTLKPRRSLVLLLVVLSFGTPVFLLPKQMESNTYLAKYYNLTFGSPLYQYRIRPISDKWLGGSLRLFIQFVSEKGDFAKKSGRPSLFIRGQMIKEAPVDQINQVFQRIENQLLKYSAIESFVTNIESSQEAKMQIRFKPTYEYADFPYSFKQQIIRHLTDYGGIDWRVYGIGKAFEKNLSGRESHRMNLKLTAYSYAGLLAACQEVKKEIQRNKRVQKISISSFAYGGNSLKKGLEYTLDLNPVQLQLAQLNAHHLYENLLSQSERNAPDRYFWIDQQTQAFRFAYPSSANSDRWWIMHAQKSKALNHRRLAEFSNLYKQEGEQAVIKENQAYIKYVKYDFIGSEHFAEKFQKKMIKQFGQQLPLGYQIKSGGDRSWWLEQKQHYAILCLIIGLVFLISAVLFESLKLPFLIISMIPLSFIGVFLSFYLFDVSFDQGGYASFLFLSGIVVNTAIYILNEYRLLRKQNPQIPALRLYIKAFNRKIIPIGLTLISTILGLIPFLLFGQENFFWRALATGTIGGLLISILTTFLIIPLFGVKTKSV